MSAYGIGVVTTDEAAACVGVSPATIRQWVVRGHLAPCRRGANPMLFRHDEVLDAAAGRRSAAWFQRMDDAASEWERECRRVGV